MYLNGFVLRFISWLAFKPYIQLFNSYLSYLVIILKQQLWMIIQKIRSTQLQIQTKLY